MGMDISVGRGADGDVADVGEVGVVGDFFKLFLTILFCSGE